MSDVLTAVNVVVDDIIDDYKNEPEIEREALIERMDEECDTLFGQLVQCGRIDQYDVHDLVRTAPNCCRIIECADEHAWIEDDSGLWDGLVFGVLASIAYFSLRNLLYQILADRGHDSNEDYPFQDDDN